MIQKFFQWAIYKLCQKDYVGNCGYFHKIEPWLAWCILIHALIGIFIFPGVLLVYYIFDLGITTSLIKDCICGTCIMLIWLIYLLR